MDQFSIEILFALLAGLICMSAFFSSSETGMMSINRYRLKHQAKENGSARRVLKLLERPDRLLGIILIGNTFANIFAASVATIIGIRLFGDYGIYLASIGLTLIILVFAEILPKTLAALHPHWIAYPVALPLKLLLWLLYPIVWVANAFVNNLLRLFGVKLKKLGTEALSIDELYTVVNEAGRLIPPSHKKMLLRILELEQASAEDIMIPRGEVIGIDSEDNIRDIRSQLRHAAHAYLPVYRKDLNNLVGILHTRSLAFIRDISKESIEEALVEPYFIPESTPLHTQLIKFQQNKKRFGVVVDEYGDILGIITLQDILEEIVGEFTTDLDTLTEDVSPQADGTFIVDGTANIRELNRNMHWELPTQGAKTLSGAIIEYLETIPTVGTCIMLDGYPIEVLQVLDNTVKAARISKRRPQEVSFD